LLQSLRSERKTGNAGQSAGILIFACAILRGGEEGLEQYITIMVKKPVVENLADFEKNNETVSFVSRSSTFVNSGKEFVNETEKQKAGCMVSFQNFYHEKQYQRIQRSQGRPAGNHAHQTRIAGV